MKTFACIVLLAACAMAAPAPEEGKRDKRGLLGLSSGLGYSGLGYSSLGYSGLGYGGLGSSLGYSDLGSYSLGSPIISHAPIVYSAPSTIIHEPAVVAVKKIVSVPRVVAVKKIISVPRYVSAPISYSSYAPSYSSGWW